MKSTNLIFLLVSALSLLFSCEKAYVLDEGGDKPSSGSGQMTVRTSARVSGESGGTDYVSYPVNVYVMNSEGKCVALRQIPSSDFELKLELEAGNYDVYAVSGTDNYSLPSADNATKNSTIETLSGKGHGDLMTASNHVELAKDEENRLTLQMERRVMQVQSVTLNNIPDDVTAVQLTMSPLYKGVLLGGGYTDGSSSHTFDLVRQSDGKTWKSASSEYLLEAKENITLKVSLTRADGVTSYSYASSESLLANYKVNITGNFVNEDAISLSGTIKGEDWAGTVTMNFDIDQNNTSGEGGGSEPEEPEVLHGGAPAQGTLYKGCFVLKTSSTANSTAVTLITPTEQNRIKVSSSKEEENVKSSIRENTAVALASIAVASVTGWRLPSEAEMAYVDENLDEINEQIEALGSSGVTTFVAKKGAYACGYFFNASDGNIYVYKLGGGEIDTTPGSERATYKVRGFATVTFTE